MDIIFSLNNIAAAATEMLQKAGQHRVFAFEAGMGAGKTTFIHALCDVLGVKDPVGSPTFSIINQYQAATGEKIFHLDLYRLRDEAEAIQAGVEDCLFSGSWCFAEWPSKAPALFPPDTVQVNISILENDQRKLTINL